MLSITVAGVLTSLKVLMASQSPAPESIHPAFLRGMTEVTAPTLAALFTNSLVAGILPAEWKSAVVCPLFK